jgi:hypothetical protein
LVEVTATSSGAARVAQADVTGDGVSDLIVGSAPGTTATVQVYDGITGKLIRTITPFETSFKGGVNVASGDMDGDGFAEIVVGADLSGGPRVQGINGKTGVVQFDFFAIIDSKFRGGVSVAVGDMNADGRADLLVGAGFTGGPRVAGYDGSKIGANGGPTLFNDFFAFESSFRGGVSVAVGDVNGDGFADPIVTPGPGGSNRVLVQDGKVLSQTKESAKPLIDFFADFGFNVNQNTRTGLRVGVGNLDADNRREIIVSAGFLPPPEANERELNVVAEPQIGVFRFKDSKIDGLPGLLAELYSFSPLPREQNDRIYVG